MANELEKKQETKADPKSNLHSAVSKMNDYYLNEVIDQNKLLDIEVTEGGKRCALNALSQLFADLGEDKVKAIPASQLSKALQFVIANEIDVFSGQAYIDKRWNKTRNAYDVSIQPMTSGLETMVRNFGAGVKSLGTPWLVRKGDPFTMPTHDGLHLVPPTWKPAFENLEKPVVLVVYPVEKVDGSVEYLMASREGVAKNVQAQILNNFLKARDTLKMTFEEIRKRIDGKTLDQLIGDEELISMGLVNPTYTSPSAREDMIVTKMKKNCLAHYTRDMGGRSRFFKDEDEDVDHSIDYSKVVSNQTGEAAKQPESDAAPSKLGAMKVNEDGTIDEAKPAEAPQKAPEATKEPQTPKAEATAKPEAFAPVEAPKAEAAPERDGTDPWDPNDL